MSARAIVAVLAGVLCADTTVVAAAPNLFDKPQQVVRRPLPRDPVNPQARTRVSCFYYPHFMAKEIDLGEKGADQLSLLPIEGGAKPPCSKDNAANERIIKDWSGYYRGVKGDYLFFDADDGWNDGVGFAVFAPDGRKLFEDVAKTWRSVALTPEGLALRYRRVYGAPCSLAADTAGCWRQIMTATGLQGDPPRECAAAYRKEQRRTPQFAKQLLEDPTVLDYDVAVTIGAGAPVIKPENAKALACRPAE